MEDAGVNLEMEVSKARDFQRAAEELADIAMATETLKAFENGPVLRVNWYEGSSCPGHEALRKLIEAQVQESWEKMHRTVIANVQRKLREARFALEEELARK